MTILSFQIPNNQTQCTIMTQPNTVLDDVEINRFDEIRVYGSSATSTVDSDKTELHRLLVVTTGQTVDTLGFELKKLGHVKKHNDFVFHIFEILN